jgi:protein-tyrosine kinase
LPENFVPVQYRPAPVDPQAMERNRVLLRVPDVGISRAYKILRTRVLHRLSANNWYTLGITGTAAGEGKSLTAVNLALALAQDVNTSVFLVDLDLQRPQLGAYLGMSYEHGLTDYLTGQAQLDQIIYDIGVKRLAVVPNASSVENSSELLRSPRMGEFITALEAQVPRRIIVFDMPPLMVTDDVLAFKGRYVPARRLAGADGTPHAGERQGSVVGSEPDGGRSEPLDRTQRQPLLLTAVDY